MRMWSLQGAGGFSRGVVLIAHALCSEVRTASVPGDVASHGTMPHGDGLTKEQSAIDLEPPAALPGAKLLKSLINRFKKMRLRSA